MCVLAPPQAVVVASDLTFVVSGSQQLQEALVDRGVNATETQLLFSSGVPGEHRSYGI